MALGAVGEHRGVALDSSEVVWIPASSLPPSVAASASLPRFSSPVPSSFPPSISSSFSSSVFSSSSFSYPSPTAGPRAPAPPPLTSSLPFCPPFASGSAPLASSSSSSSSFPISSILSSAPSSVLHSFFAPPLAPVSASSVASFPYPLPFVSSASVSWSLPVVVSCLAPSLVSFSAPAPSGPFPPAPPPPPSALFPRGASFSSSSAPPLPAAVPSSGVSGVPSSALFVPSGVGTLAPGVSAFDAPHNSFSFASTSGADFSDPCYFCDCDDSLTKGKKESPALVKGESSKIFHKVVNLMTGFFPHAKSDSSSSSSESFPWLDVVNVSQQCHPCIFLTLFEKLAAVSKEVFEKFCKAADIKKRTLSAFPAWGDVYHLSNLPEFHKAPELNECFSHLMEKTLASLRSVALSLNETCLHGMIES